MVAQTFSSLGYAFDSVIVLFVKDWKWLQLALAICPLPILIVLFLLVDESPKYSAFVLFFFVMPPQPCIQMAMAFCVVEVSFRI